MHTITYIVCFLFYNRLRGVGSDKSNARFWSSIYGFVTFVALAIGTTDQIFYGYGRPFISSSAQNPDLIEPGVLGALFIAILLGWLFFYTIKLGGEVIGSRFVGVLFAVPGLFINAIVADILLSLL